MRVVDGLGQRVLPGEDGSQIRASASFYGRPRRLEQGVSTGSVDRLTWPTSLQEACRCEVPNPSIKRLIEAAGQVQGAGGRVHFRARSMRGQVRPSSLTARPVWHPEKNRQAPSPLLRIEGGRSLRELARSLIAHRNGLAGVNAGTRAG